MGRTRHNAPASTQAPAEVDSSHLPEAGEVEVSEPGLDHDGNPLPRTTGKDGGTFGVATEGAGAFGAQAPGLAVAGSVNADPSLPRIQAGVAAGETQPGIQPPGEATGESVRERPVGEDDKPAPRHVDKRGRFIRAGNHLIVPEHIVRIENTATGAVKVVTVAGEVTVPSQHAKEFHEALGTDDDSAD